ncbi:unnamed protein product [Prorocentrum cordatum]|uniref:Uncharacterized protein n=1 Tax=Prorocentrum cordatum TaxID=2364126 RepID=A0ABN9VDU1_9DINO|nr:unnamed protein product [Polarella glacialis]
MPRGGGDLAEAADCQERDLLLDGGSRLVARPQPRAARARLGLALLACTAVAACAIARHGGGQEGGGSRGARPAPARLVPENTSSGAVSYPLQVKQQRKAEKHWDGSADEVTCAMIGCGKVADAPCQCTTRCSRGRRPSWQLLPRLRRRLQVARSRGGAWRHGDAAGGARLQQRGGAVRGQTGPCPTSGSTTPAQGPPSRCGC